ncbi:MAG: hypothetical protein Q9211_001776 [Gyalolechia sp. 1 TL-2023]
MLLKFPTIIVAASVASLCLAAPIIEGNELSTRESSATADATEICGCPLGKVGYFLHERCACSGDPISPPYETRMPGPQLGSRVTRNGAPPTQVQSGCPHCSYGFWGCEDSLGKCYCRTAFQNGDLSFKEVETFRGKRQAPSHGYPDTPDALFFDSDDVKWQMDCVNEKNCPPGPRGRDISAMHPEPHLKPGTVIPSFSPRIRSSSTRSAEAQQKCSLSKPCPPGRRSWPVKDVCMCTKSNEERDASDRNGFEEKRDALVMNAEKGEHVPRMPSTSCFRSPECPKIGRGWHGLEFHNRCVCVPPTDEHPDDKRVSAELNERSDIENASCQHRTVENRDICYCGIDRDSSLPQGPASFGPHGVLRDGYEQDPSSAPVDLDGEAAQVQQRSTHLNTKRQDSDGCQNLGCPAGYIPSMDGGVCYCGIDGGFPYPQSPVAWDRKEWMRLVQTKRICHREYTPLLFPVMDDMTDLLNSNSVALGSGTDQAGSETFG